MSSSSIAPARLRRRRVSAASVLLAAALVPGLAAAPAAADPLTPPSGPQVGAPGDGVLPTGDATLLPGVPEATLRSAAAGVVLASPVAAVALPAALDLQPIYQAQISCDPIDKPGSRALGQLVTGTYHTGMFGVSRWCDGSVSEHAEGRAVDWMLDSTDTTQRAVGDTATAWLIADSGAQARRLGVQYIIWNRRMWRAYAPERGWQPYTGVNPHTDHVHLSLTWDGAMQRTSWWTGAVASSRDLGPCRVWAGQPAPIWSARRTGPCPPAQPAPSAPKPVYVPGQRHADIAIAQGLLGITADGSFGYGTRSAVLSFQARSSLPRTGVLDSATWVRLLPVTTGPTGNTPTPSPTPTPTPTPTDTAPPPVTNPAPVASPPRSLPLPAVVTTRYTPFKQVRLRAGARGAAVRVLQRGLAVPATGVFDAPTTAAVRALQRVTALPVSGVVDVRTWNRVELRQFPWLAQRARLLQGSSGSAVAALQRALRVTPDGHFGPATRRAVLVVQARYGLAATGVVDPLTWRAVAAQGPR